MMGKDELQAMQMVRRNREIQKPLVEKYGGTWLKEMNQTIIANKSGQAALLYKTTRNNPQVKVNKDHPRSSSRVVDTGDWRIIPLVHKTS